MTDDTTTLRTGNGTKASTTRRANGAATRVAATPTSETTLSGKRVFLNYEGQRDVIPDTLVLKGTNRTDHAVWWFLEGPTGRTTH